MCNPFFGKILLLCLDLYFAIADVIEQIRLLFVVPKTSFPALLYVAFDALLTYHM